VILFAQDFATLASFFLLEKEAILGTGVVELNESNFYIMEDLSSLPFH